MYLWCIASDDLCFRFSINKPALLARPRSNQEGSDLARVQPRPYGPVVQLRLGNDHLLSPSPLRLSGVKQHPAGTTPGIRPLNQEQALNSHLPRPNMPNICLRFQVGELYYKRITFLSWNIDQMDYFQKITPKVVGGGKPHITSRNTINRDV